MAANETWVGGEDVQRQPRRLRLRPGAGIPGYIIIQVDFSECIDGFGFLWFERCSSVVVRAFCSSVVRALFERCLTMVNCQNRIDPWRAAGKIAGDQLQTRLCEAPTLLLIGESTCANCLDVVSLPYPGLRRL